MNYHLSKRDFLKAVIITSALFETENVLFIIRVSLGKLAKVSEKHVPSPALAHQHWSDINAGWRKSLGEWMNQQIITSPKELIHLVNLLRRSTFTHPCHASAFYFIKPSSSRRLHPPP